MRSEKGLSLIEAAVILAILSILTASLAPAIQGSLANACQTKAREDVGVLASALEIMLKDTGETFMLQNGHGTGATDPPSRAVTNRVNMLLGRGMALTVNPSIVRLPVTLTDWNDPIDNLKVMSFDAHLVTNTALYRSPAQMTVLVQFDPDSGSGSNSEFGWRGGYLAPNVGPDCWGHPYAANVEFLGRQSGSSNPSGSENDVMVLSAGPNGRVDTLFEASASSTTGGTTIGADDIIVFVQGSMR